jgi:hypothetical protein
LPALSSGASGAVVGVSSRKVSPGVHSSLNPIGARRSSAMPSLLLSMAAVVQMIGLVAVPTA